MTAPTVTMQAPTAAFTNITTASGRSYFSDSNGLVQNVNAQDVQDLQRGGYTVVAPGFSAFPVALHHARNLDGSTLAAAASSGKFGQSITLGTASRLVSEAANNSTVTDSVFFDLVLPPSFAAGYNPTVTVNGNHVIGSGVLTTHTLAAHLYPINNDGTHDADIITTAAQNTLAAAGDTAFASAALNELSAGMRALLELVVVLTETSTHAVTFNLNSVRIG